MAFLRRWLPRTTGEAYDTDRHADFVQAYRRHLDVEATEHFTHRVAQTVADFVACQHSRDSFAPSRLGTSKGEFDAELADLLAPYATDGLLVYDVRVELNWGYVGAT